MNTTQTTGSTRRRLVAGAAVVLALGGVGSLVVSATADEPGPGPSPAMTGAGSATTARASAMEGPDLPEVEEKPDPVIVARGDEGRQVETWQTNLNLDFVRTDGAPEVAVDGVFGEETEAATRAFQQEWEIPVDGRVTQNDMSAIPSVVFVNTPTDVEAGAQGPLGEGDVSYAVLGWKTYLMDEQQLVLPMDDVFGPRTTEATVAFQAMRGISADGIVDALTRDEMQLQRYGG